MLYAVSSTGALSRGTIRPAGDDGPMSDPEWSDYLAWKLERELCEVIEHCSGDNADAYAYALDREDYAADLATARDWLRKLATIRAALELESDPMAARCLETIRRIGGNVTAADIAALQGTRLLETVTALQRLRERGAVKRSSAGTYHAELEQ